MNADGIIKTITAATLACVPQNTVKLNAARIQSNGGHLRHISRTSVYVSCSLRHNTLYRVQQN